MSAENSEKLIQPDVTLRKGIQSFATSKVDAGLVREDFTKWAQWRKEHLDLRSRVPSIIEAINHVASSLLNRHLRARPDLFIFPDQQPELFSGLELDQDLVEVNGTIHILQAERSAVKLANFALYQSASGALVPVGFDAQIAAFQEREMSVISDAIGTFTSQVSAHFPSFAFAMILDAEVYGSSQRLLKWLKDKNVIVTSMPQAMSQFFELACGSCKDNFGEYPHTMDTFNNRFIRARKQRWW